MIQVPRKHPSLVVYLDDKIIVTYYKQGDRRNKGEASVSSGYRSLLSTLQYNKQEIQVTAARTIKDYKNGEYADVFKLRTATKEMQEMNENQEMNEKQVDYFDTLLRSEMR